MVNICISRITGSSDYDNFGMSPNFKKNRLEENSNYINFKYFYSKEKEFTTLILKGSDFKRWDKEGKKFIDFFKNNESDVSKNNGVSELEWLIDIIEQIINMIDNNIWKKINNENKAKLFIHWGGEGRNEATKRLLKAAGSITFPFDVVTWSSLDEAKQKIHHLFNTDNIEDIIKSNDDLAKSFDVADVKKKIIELKQKTASLWHPLAIDIQGLKLCGASKKEYLLDIVKNKQPGNYSQLILKLWNCIYGCANLPRNLPNLDSQIPTKNNANLQNFLNTLGKGAIIDDYFPVFDKSKHYNIGLAKNKDRINYKSKFIKILFQFEDYLSDLIPLEELLNTLEENYNFFPDWVKQLDAQFGKIINHIN